MNNTTQTQAQASAQTPDPKCSYHGEVLPCIQCDDEPQAQASAQTAAQWKFVRKIRKGGGLGPRCIVRAGDFDGIGGPVVAQIQDATQDEIALIAAAPETAAQRDELLAALRDCADWLARSARIDDQEQAQDARAAIARADGRAQ